MNNRKTMLYQMLTIRNSTASDARMRAAHTAGRVGAFFGVGLYHARFDGLGGRGNKKGFGFPKPFESINSIA
jgi:hypothetical protein